MVGLPGESMAQGDTIVAMTYNIRYDNPQDWKHHWNLRKERLIRQIRTARPHILGCQEVLHNQLADLAAALPQYNHVGVGRDDGNEAGEYAPIFVDEERYKILQSGTFWLSSTPDTPSLGWDAACPRIVTWAQIMENGSRKKLFVFNAHLDHVGTVARQMSVLLLQRKMKELTKGQPALLMGDFNFTPDDANYSLLLNTGSQLKDSFSKAAVDTEPVTFPGNGFTTAGSEPGKRIDYVLVGTQFRTHRTHVLRSVENGAFPSDHLPLVTWFSWR